MADDGEEINSIVRQIATEKGLSESVVLGLIERAVVRADHHGWPDAAFERARNVAGTVRRVK